MVVPGESSNNISFLIEAIGSSPSFEKKTLPITDDKSPPSNAGKEKKKPIKDKKELLEHIILKHATSKKLIGSPDATDEEKAENRQRILNAKTTRWRIIFSKWPRDPKGKFITPTNSALGKMAPNNAQLWGATLFDFYTVNRLPETKNLVTLSSGSKLAAWMKANGEDYAKNQLEFAEDEDDPHLILPYEITKLIHLADSMQPHNKKSWIRDEQDQDVIGKEKEKNKERECWQVPQPVCLSTILFLCSIYRPPTV
jgi:hypothetical protein